MSVRSQPTLPWSISDARSSFLPMLFGAVLLVWAWWDASGTGKLDDQTRAVVLAVLGIAVIGAGSLGWIAAGRRAVRDRRNRVIDSLERSGLARPLATTSTDTSDDLVVVGGTTRYHRSHCLLVRGKTVRPLDEDARTTTLTPCEMCRP